MDSRKTNINAIRDTLSLANDASKLLQTIEQELEKEKDEIYKKWYIAILPAAWRPNQVEKNETTVQALSELQLLLLRFQKKAEEVYVKVEEPLEMVQYDSIKNLYKNNSSWKWIQPHQDIYDLIKIRELSAFIAEVQLTLTQAEAEEEKFLTQNIPLELEQSIRKE